MKTALIAFLVLIDIAAIAQLKIPKDYVELTESPSNGKNMKRLMFNFDDDNIMDYATIIQHKTEFAKYKLLIYLSSTKKQEQVDLLTGSDFNIYPTELKLQKNVLQFGYFLDGTSAFGRLIKLRYNTNNKKIQIIGYDTGYRALANSRIDKTFNLLTGKYIVSKKEYTNGSNEKEIVNEFKGINGGFKNVYIENLTLKLLKNLDAVGNKYALAF